MGEARVRKARDPLYGLLPKGSDSPLWAVHRGVLFLIDPKKDSIACLPGNNMVELNTDQVAALDNILKGAPALLPMTHTEE